MNKRFSLPLPEGCQGCIVKFYLYLRDRWTDRSTLLDD